MLDPQAPGEHWDCRCQQTTFLSISSLTRAHTKEAVRVAGATLDLTLRSYLKIPLDRPFDGASSAFSHPSRRCPPECVCMPCCLSGRYDINKTLHTDPPATAQRERLKPAPAFRQKSRCCADNAWSPQKEFAVRASPCRVLHPSHRAVPWQNSNFSKTNPAMVILWHAECGRAPF